MLNLAANLRFFSRFPVPSFHPRDDPMAMPDFRRAPRAFAIAGLVLAMPAMLLLVILAQTALPPTALAVIVAATLSATTGGLHEDGLADCADGFFGSHSQTRRLEIMKDSHVGTFGVLVVVFVLILRITLLAAILGAYGIWACIFALPAMAAAGRAAALWPWLLLSPARPGGLAERYGAPGKSIVLQANLSVLIICLPLFGFYSLAQITLALACCLIASLCVGQLAHFKIGGHTGDVIGASEQMAETGFLLGLLLLHSA
ncbi:MAG: adenosylcobinamide-GDP ribazoletransferase [Stappiaceae bacterium]